MTLVRFPVDDAVRALWLTNVFTRDASVALTPTPLPIRTIGGFFVYLAVVILTPVMGARPAAFRAANFSSANYGYGDVKSGAAVTSVAVASAAEENTVVQFLEFVERLKTATVRYAR